MYLQPLIDIYDHTHSAVSEEYVQRFNEIAPVQMSIIEKTF
jgi:hypothetical protein